MNYDIEGMGKTRQALAALAHKPRANNRTMIYQRALEELYTEIRAARIAGHSWKTIAETITQHSQIGVSAQAVCRVFRQLDNQHARESGVPALEPIETRGRRAKK